MITWRKFLGAPQLLLVTALGAGALAVVGCRSLGLFSQDGRRAGPSLPPPPLLEAGGAAKSAECIECHTDIGKEFVSDAHKADDFSCVTCHGLSKKHLEKVDLDALPERTWRHWDGKQWVERVPQATWEVARFCASCHAAGRAASQGTPAMGWEAFAAHRHGEALQRGSADAPTCTDCHAAHGVTRQPWQPEEIVELCGACHGNLEMMKRAGLKGSVIEDFRSGTHGAMPKVKPEQRTSCLSCHHPHAKYNPK